MKKSPFVIQCSCLGMLWMLAWLSVLPAQAQNAIHLYVSPTGNDAAKGTSASEAFRTLEKAQQAVRALKQQGKLNAPLVVNVAAGQYDIQKPLIFTEADGGTEAAPITYSAAPGDQVFINGGKTITGWKPYKKGIWMTRLPVLNGKSWTFRQLFVDGQRRTRARTPNQGFFRVQGFPDGGPEKPYNTASGRFEYAAGDLDPQWKNLQDVEVIVYHFWTDAHMPIQSIDTKSRVVTFQHKTIKVFTDDFTKAGARYVVENVWEGLDSPGEWYLDKKTSLLYYMPLPGEDLREVEVIAPVTPDFIRIEGKPMEQQLVSNLTFRNLTFTYSNWELPPGNANDEQGSASVPAGISLKGAKSCVFEQCAVRNIGTFAFDLGSGCQDNRISHCRLTGLGGGGIRINGGTERDHPWLRTGNTVVNDNLIDRFGEEFPSAVGILLMHTNRNLILHNEISNGSYTGVSVGWVWGYARSVSTHNRIEYNYIHHIGQKGLLSDMGGVYTLGVSTGTTVRNNIIHDVSANHYGGWGIYNDEGSTHILIENNLVYHTKFAAYNIHYGKENLVRNNIFALGKKEQLSRNRTEPHKSVFFENNILYWQEGELWGQNWNDKPFTFFRQLGDTIQEKSTFETDYNVYFNPKAIEDTLKFNGESREDWKKRGKDAHSIFADPLFVDVSQLDFRLKPESPALRLGFVPIDFSTVGIRKKPDISSEK